MTGFDKEERSSYPDDLTTRADADGDAWCPDDGTTDPAWSPAIHTWDPTGPDVGDGGWRVVTDPAEIAQLDVTLVTGAVGEVYVAYTPTYEVWITPEGVAAPAPDGWTIDDGYVPDPALPPSDLHLSQAPKV